MVEKKIKGGFYQISFVCLRTASLICLLSSSHLSNVIFEGGSEGREDLKHSNFQGDILVAGSLSTSSGKGFQ